MTAGIKANVDGSAAIQVGGVDAITLTSAGAASFVTSPMTIQGGSAAAPSLTFSGDTNTGIFSPAADTIAFSEGGVESMRVDSSGRLLLGLTTPITSWGSGKVQEFQIAASGSRYPGLSCYAFSTTGAGDGAMINLGRSRSTTVGTMTQTQSGDVLGYLLFEGVNSSNALVGGGYISVTQTGAAGSVYIPASMTFFTSDATNGNNPRMVIDPTGNVGIGTSSPGARLQVTDGNFNQIYLNSTTTVCGVRFGNSGSTNGYIYYDNGANLTFQTNGAERARIDSSGNLLVGTTSSTARITALGASTTGANIALYAGDSAGADLFFARCDGVINTGTRSASPFNNTTGSAANMFVNSAGVLQRSTSSLKYKANIQDATHGLAELLSLRPVTYEGKAESDAGKTFGGLIAEEVHDAGLTEFVQYAEDGTPDALAYGNMVSLCIKAIQELKAELDATKAEVALLKGAA